jgi:hypothetical protein
MLQKLNIYKACSKKNRTFAIKPLLPILQHCKCTVQFKVVPFTGDLPFPKSLPFLEYFLERTFCEGAQFS